MTVRDTSFEAYESIRKSLCRKQKVVFGFFEDNQGEAFCNRYAAQILEWPINRITPRVLELRKKGLLVEAGKRKYEGRNVHVWRAITKPQKQQTLFD